MKLIRNELNISNLIRGFDVDIMRDKDNIEGQLLEFDVNYLNSYQEQLDLRSLLKNVSVRQRLQDGKLFVVCYTKKVEFGKGTN